MINIDQDGGLPFREAVQFLPEAQAEIKFRLLHIP